MSTSHNRNPSGRNQHGDKVSLDDPRLVAALIGYHEELMTSNKMISERMAVEHEIVLSESSIKRARKRHGLLGGASNLKKISQADAEQLVLDQLDLDPAGHAGPRTIRHRIAAREQEHLPRAFVNQVMKTHAPDGFEKRNPSARRIIRFPKVPVGIHERWSCDGHDKLYKIGFPAYGFVDDSTGKWLYGKIVPSNRFGVIIGYLYLCCVEKYGGIPSQVTTDCGSETTLTYGLQNTLREIFHPDFDDLHELPAHVYLRSVHNITVERSWLRLRLDWGDNAVIVFGRGEAEGWYNPHDISQQELCTWLWAKLLQQVFDDFMRERNSYKARKDNSKAGPSGMSRNTAFSLPEQWGGTNCLLPVDIEVIQHIKEEMGGDELLEFVSRDFSNRAEAAYQALGVQKLSFENVWHVFKDLHRKLFLRV